MPYCPRCDMEFIDGITVCTDCGGPLVESEEAAKAMKAAERERNMAREKAMYEAFMNEAEEETAEEEASEAGENEEYSQSVTDDLSEEGGKTDTQAPPRRERVYAYVDKSQKYDDLKSSASAFLAVGCVLGAVSVLLWTGVIRLPMATVSKMIFQGALTLMAAFSIGVYLNTIKTAKELAPQIDQEKQRTEELIQWFTEKYSADDIDGEIPEKENLAEEELSLKRFQLIQDYLITGQDLPDQAYVDALSEEIYTKIFE